MPASELSFQTLSLTLNSDPTIRADFTYTYSGFFPKTSDFLYYLNGSILDNLFITWTITPLNVWKIYINGILIDTLNNYNYPSLNLYNTCYYHT